MFAEKISIPASETLKLCLLWGALAGRAPAVLAEGVAEPAATNAKRRFILQRQTTSRFFHLATQPRTESVEELLV